MRPDPASHSLRYKSKKCSSLLDEAISQDIGGKQFDFEPYDYGPFDRDVYAELNHLQSIGLVELSYVNPTAGGRRYGLSLAGYQAGRAILENLPPTARAYITDVANWVLRLSFAQLVGSIYKAFPHMRAKSIFVE
ncbi:hypothetical protein ACRAWD_13670 [Caulobacter segnis]